MAVYDNGILGEISGTVGRYDINEANSSYMLDAIPFSGRPVQTYIGFIARGRQKTSESRYMGLIDILS